GVKNLVQLLRKPRQYVPWAELLALPDSDSPRSEQPAFTPEAVRSIQEDRRRLQQEIDEAENDVDRADSERRLAALNAKVKKDLGLGGQPRDLNNPLKRYRAKIHGRLRDVYAKMREGSQPLKKLADHFETYITSTESGYTYAPPEPLPPWKLDPP